MSEPPPSRRGGPPSPSKGSSSSSSAAAATMSASQQSLSREAWSVPASEIVIDPRAMVGEGFFGIVYKAQWRDLTVCAKKLKNVRSGEAANFQKEVELCARLRHPHLVQFLAACTAKSHLCIVSEWMAGGSLYSYLHERSVVAGARYSRTDHPTLLRIASEVATAMVYLHASHIVHRDLTSSNILLDARGVTKVSDFGLSRPMTDSSMSGLGGNLYYLAPESFLLQQFTPASDVFAFGVVLNELMTGTPPFKGVPGALAASECANRGARPNLASSTPVGIVRLIVQCWSHDPAQRPTFRQVLSTLQELTKEMTDEMQATEATPSTPIASSATTPSTSGESTTSSGERRKGKMKRAPSDAALASLPSSTSSSTTSTPSRSVKAKSSKAAPVAASASSHGAYDRPHTPDSDAELATNGTLETNGSTVSSSSSRHSKSPTRPILISPDSSVSPKDVRLFLVCLKKHMPSHDAFILHKPEISAIDLYCDSTKSTKPQYAKGASSRSASTADSLLTTTAFRSRSEGDADGVDLKPRPHTCSPTANSSFYPNKMPAVGELVVCRAKRCEDSFATYELCEYTMPQIIGMASTTELTKRKMRSISKLVSIGQLDVLRVLHVDEARGFVDLSKKEISEYVRSSTLTYFAQAEAAHLCILAAARSLGTCSYCLYHSVIWPLADRYESSVYKLLRLSIISPALTFGEYRECACLQRHHASLAAANSTATATPLHILTTPRVLPEIERRCQYHRVHLNLARLALDTLPTQLVSADVDESESGVSEEGETNGRRKGSRANSTASSRRSSGSVAAVDKSSLFACLRSLNLEENPLRELPSCIGAFRKLQELNVNACGLSDLPLALGQCAGLQRLYAFGNEFVRVPVVVRSLLQLTQLNLSANRMASVEVGDLSCLTQLLELSLAHNLLETLLPASLPTSLQTLDISWNRLHRFPMSLFELSSIVSLELKHNKIDSLPAPPISAGVTPLRYLEWLDASHNSLSSVHNALFTGCRYLEWISLTHNALTSIPASLWDLVKNKTPPQVEEAKLDTSVQLTAMDTDGTTAAPVGLLYLNLQFNKLSSSSTSVAAWSDLATNIPQFLFDDSAVPKNGARTGSGSSLVVPAATIATSSPPVTPQLTSVPSQIVAPLMHTWSVDQVAAWLRTESLDEFVEAFRENLITGATLLELDKGDLRDDLGVKQLGVQKRILKLIQVHADQIQAAVATASAAATPNSVSLQASPFIAAQTSADLALSSLSLGPRAIEGGAPPSVAVRRANTTTLSPSSSMISFAAASTHAAAGAGSGCDLRSCERIKSSVLRAAVMSEAMGKPVLLRCVVVLLIGTVYTAEDARDALEAAVAAGRSASLAAGGAASGAFHGLQAGPRSQLTIAPLLLPTYLLSLTCLLPSEGVALIESVIVAMSGALDERGQGGRAKVLIRPYVVDVLPSESFGESSSAATSGVTGAAGLSSSPAPSPNGAHIGLHRTKSGGHSTTGFSGEIVAALQSFRTAQAEEAAERARKREEAAKRKQKDGEVRKKKKMDRQSSGESTAEGQQSSAANASVTAGAFD